MSRTGNYMNWGNVTVTPANGSAILIKGVTDVDPDMETKQEMAYGDNRSFPKMVRATEVKRSIAITSDDVGAIYRIPLNVPCVVTATLLDALNGAGAGAITITLVNACVEKVTTKGPNNKFAGATISFNSFGDVGTGGVEVDPMTIVEAT